MREFILSLSDASELKYCIPTRYRHDAGTLSSVPTVTNMSLHAMERYQREKKVWPNFNFCLLFQINPTNADVFSHQRFETSQFLALAFTQVPEFTVCTLLFVNC